MRSIYSNNKKTLIKTLISLLVICGGFKRGFAQETQTDLKTKSPNNIKLKKNYPVSDSNAVKEFGERKFKPPKEPKVIDALLEENAESIDIDTKELESDRKFFLKKEFIELEEKKIKEFSIKMDERLKVPEKFQKSEKFHWKPAIVESLYFLGIQQGFRMVQKKTRRELDGEFFADWGTSVKNLGGWRDGDSFATNYIAHPMQGAVTGRIFINNSDKSKKLDFGMSKDYWKSRVKTMAWSAVWSTQFELGPISEASIGNVGLYDRTGPNLMGWVDLVVTPIAGTGVIIGEDLIDKFVLKKWLEKDSSRTRIKLFRTFFTPFQSFTNVLRWKAPWKRDNR